MRKHTVYVNANIYIYIYSKYKSESEDVSGTTSNPPKPFRMDLTMDHLTSTIHRSMDS